MKKSNDSFKLELLSGYIINSYSSSPKKQSFLLSPSFIITPNKLFSLRFFFKKYKYFLFIKMPYSGRFMSILFVNILFKSLFIIKKFFSSSILFSLSSMSVFLYILLFIFFIVLKLSIILSGKMLFISLFICIISK